MDAAILQLRGLVRGKRAKVITMAALRWVLQNEVPKANLDIRPNCRARRMDEGRVLGVCVHHPSPSFQHEGAKNFPRVGWVFNGVDIQS